MTIAANADMRQTNETGERLEPIRVLLNEGRVSAARDSLDLILEALPDEPEVLYLRGQACLTRGEPRLVQIIDHLRRLGAVEYADILYLKLLQLIGDSEFESWLKHCRSAYPNSPEIAVSAWIHQHDLSGGLADTTELNRLGEQAVLGFAPYIAAFCRAADVSCADGLRYLDMLHEKVPYRWGSYDQTFAARESLGTMVDIGGAMELEYAECGSQMGMYFVDANGRKLKMSLDTGTGGRGFTVHHDSIGNRLPGDTVLVIEDGIFYNYMSEPADVVFKAVDFSEPHMKAFPVEYFQGGFTLADGCFSPFALEGAAITMDPIRKRVMLRDRQALREYRDSLSADSAAFLPMVVRNSWPYIEVGINGQKALFMIESGSRDVNVNELAALHLGVEAYDSSIVWRGKDYPMRMFNDTITVGRFEYEVIGGHVSERVMGNHNYGAASAGDIGPDFLRNFVWTVDPFRRELILVKPSVAEAPAGG
jgi:hypothetical protein